MIITNLIERIITMTTIFKEAVIETTDDIEYRLSEHKAALNTVYWDLHKRIAKNSYKNIDHQLRDAEKLGQVATAMKAIRSAQGSLQQLKR